MQDHDRTFVVVVVVVVVYSSAFYLSCLEFLSWWFALQYASTPIKDKTTNFTHIEFNASVEFALMNIQEGQQQLIRLYAIFIYLYNI